MKWIGLTGGIATGKSTVKKRLEVLNIPVIDADLISHELSTVGGLGYKAIVSHFGHEILNPDQTIHRKKLGEIVFNDSQKLLQLEQLLHPLIQAEVQTRKAKFKSQGQALCFYDVPLLFEKKLEKQFDQIVLVYAPITTQVDRIMLRDGLSHTQALARISAQLPMAAKIQRSHHCLDNSTHNEDLGLQVLNLVKVLTQNPT
ncbi:dephospho-CoA kinase [Bdellovibrio sp. qaytius]|nr:dephospho-CoA kinase [Bdellovibrio sp. qaytius]